MTASSAAASTYGAVGVGSLYRRSGQASPSSAGTPTVVAVHDAAGRKCTHTASRRRPRRRCR
ncbi:hypothetical protein [Streptomyces sp. NPDC053069]|uniref:hypothetical protein n=1 Tax=Streptomyces sp. NPDC053069 TaxID=3365695 RepID=UPI0037D5C194